MNEKITDTRVVAGKVVPELINRLQNVLTFTDDEVDFDDLEKVEIHLDGTVAVNVARGDVSLVVQLNCDGILTIIESIHFRARGSMPQELTNRKKWDAFMQWLSKWEGSVTEANLTAISLCPTVHGQINTKVEGSFGDVWTGDRFFSGQSALTVH